MITFRLAVVGSRSYGNVAWLRQRSIAATQAIKTALDQYDDLADYLDKLLADRCAEGAHIVIVSGGAPGADTCAKRYALARSYEYVEFAADWSQGRSAGFVRNRRIVENADAVVAAWDGVSAGTMSTLKLARERGLPVRIKRFVATP